MITRKTTIEVVELLRKHGWVIRSRHGIGKVTDLYMLVRGDKELWMKTYGDLVLDIAINQKHHVSSK
jgi:hypothetical protein